MSKMENDDVKPLSKDECKEKLAEIDFIMEPNVFNVLKRFFQCGGTPKETVSLLSTNYEAVAQTVNLLAEWLIMLGMQPNEVKEIVQNHLKELLVKHFDPERADNIFQRAGQHPSWLLDLIGHKKWRQLFYKLAEEYPECLMVKYTIKLISDAGHQAEITNVLTACAQLEVFSKVLRTGLENVLQTNDEEELIKSLPELARMVCHAEHTYLYSQVVMSILSNKNQYAWSKLRRISQEIHKYANNKENDVTHIVLSLTSQCNNYPRAKQSIMSMLHRGQLNPGDVTVLHQIYSNDDPPPVQLLHLPMFLDMFIEALFTSKGGAKINNDFVHKYVFVLAYAASVIEHYDDTGERAEINTDELQSTIEAIEHVQQIAAGVKETELLSEIKDIYTYIQYPVVGMGVLKWVEFTVSDLSYFERQMENLHLMLLDEVIACHTLLHGDALKILINLFDQTFTQLDTLVQMEMKKTVLDRMVHLMTYGCVIPVVTYIRDCMESTDASLIRYFVVEVLDIIEPPYTEEFGKAFLPILQNNSITAPIKSIKSEDESDPVSDFIRYCRNQKWM